MKKFFVLLSALLVLTSCDFDRIRLSGQLVSKDFAIEGTYTKLDVSSAFKVTVCDTVSQITVTTDEVIMPKVEVIKQGAAVTLYLLPNMFVTMALIIGVVFLGLKVDAKVIALIFIVIVGALAAASYARVMALVKKA